MVSGLRQFVPIEQMVGRLVLVVTNLKPASLAGIESNGLVLCASNADHTLVEILEPPSENVPIGERVSFCGHLGEAPALLNPKIWHKAKKELRTNAEGEAIFSNVKFMTSAGVIKARSLVNSEVA